MTAAHATRLGLALVFALAACSGSGSNGAATGGAAGTSGNGASGGSGAGGNAGAGGTSNAGGAGGAAGSADASSPNDAGATGDATESGSDGATHADAAAPKDGAAPDAGTRPIVGVYVGNSTTDVLAHEAWLGRPVDGILGYTGAASWTDYDGSVGWAAGSGMWGAIDRRVLWSVPLFPTGATLAEAASGAYDDAHYKKAAGILKDFRPSEPVLHIRTAWEFNGDWFPWQCVAPSCLADSIGAFRHFVTSFRSVSSRFRFTFCPNVGPANATYPLEDSYPGDDYVDIIGIDIYAGWYPTDTTTPEQRWQYQLDRQYGLNWLVSFANAHKKPIAIPEWGVGDNGSGDDPVFVKGMHDFCETNGCVYMSYWDSNAAYQGELRAGQYPNAAAAYKAAFGHP